MLIRLGYVSIALNLKNITTSSTVTYTRYLKLDEKERLQKLKLVTSSNLEALDKILDYNIKNDIHFYRITSNLIPLKTHPEVNWDYLKYFKDDLKYLGKKIKENNLRVDFHPDQFNVLSTDRKEVLESTIRSLCFQSELFEQMDYPDGKLVVHLGSGRGGKQKAIDRFFENIKKLPTNVLNRIIIENDDKTFTAKEVLEVCQKTNLPMVLDVHHHNCNNNGERLENLIDNIFKTWQNQKLIPKIHFSSPKEFKNDKKHADYINVYEFLDFLEIAKKTNQDFDVMIEAKKKDLAVFDLIKNLKTRNIKFKDKTTIILG